jgi:hypothetical protein
MPLPQNLLSLSIIVLKNLDVLDSFICFEPSHYVGRRRSILMIYLIMSLAYQSRISVGLASCTRTMRVV